MGDGGEAAVVLKRLAAGPGRAERLTHVESVPPRAGRTGAWPRWVPEEVLSQLADAGIVTPWSHQVATAEAAYSTWWWTSATTTAGCSAPMSLRCCAGSAGSVPSTAPTRSSCAHLPLSRSRLFPGSG